MDGANISNLLMSPAPSNLIQTVFQTSPSTRALRRSEQAPAPDDALSPMEICIVQRSIITRKGGAVAGSSLRLRSPCSKDPCCTQQGRSRPQCLPLGLPRDVMKLRLRGVTKRRELCRPTVGGCARLYCAHDLIVQTKQGHTQPLTPSEAFAVALLFGHQI